MTVVILHIDDATPLLSRSALTLFTNGSVCVCVCVCVCVRLFYRSLVI